MAAVAGEIVKVAVETVAVKVVEEIVKNAPSAEQVYRQASPEEWNEMDNISDDCLFAELDRYCAN